MRIKVAVVAVVLCVTGSAASMAQPQPLAVPETGSLLIRVAQDRNFKALCKKLQRCRSKYTYCFDQIEKHPRRDQWSAMRTACVDKYKLCIDKNFKSGEILFTRWFVRDPDCK